MEIAVRAEAMKLYGGGHGLTEDTMRQVFEAVNRELADKLAGERLTEIEERLGILVAALQRMGRTVDLASADAG